MSVPGQYGRPVADPKTMRVAVRVKCCTFMRHNSTVCLAFFAASLVYEAPQAVFAVRTETTTHQAFQAHGAANGSPSDPLLHPLSVTTMSI